MSDSDSDSDSSSDIGALLQKSKEEVRRMRKTPDSEDSDLSDDDSDSDEIEEVHLSYSSRGRGRNKRGSVEARLAEMDQEARIRKRQRLLASRQRKDSDDDDDDDDDDDEVQYAGSSSARDNTNRAVKVQVEVSREGEENKKPTAAIKTTIDIDLDSSDDDEKPPASSTRGGSAAALSLNGVSASAREQLEKSRRAILELQQAQTYHAPDVYGTAATAASSSVMDLVSKTQDQQRSYHGRLLLRVNAKFERTDGSAPETKASTTDVSIWASQTVSELEAMIRQQLKLDKDAVVTMECKGAALRHANRSLSTCGIQSDATIDALVLVSSLDFAVSKPAAAALGKSIKVVLRRMIDGNKNPDEQELSIHMKEPFQVLVDKYREKNNLAKSARVVLEFDGDTLSMESTPQKCDMESEDLIDVKVS